MKKFFTAVDRLEEVVCVVLCITFVLLAVLQIITRFTPLTVPWTEELARYTFIWFCWIGLSWGIKDCDHLKIDVLVMNFPPKAKRIHLIACNILMLVFNVAVFWFSFDVIRKQQMLAQRMVNLPIPLWAVYLVVPIAFGLGSLRCVQVVVKNILALVRGEGKEEEA